MSDFTPYQQKIVQRYYRNRDQIAEQRLGELVADLFLAKGKKLDQLWKSAATALEKVGLPRARIDHILSQRDPVLIATVVKELQAKGG